MSHEYRASGGRTHDSVAQPRTFAARRATSGRRSSFDARAIARLSIAIDPRKHRRLLRVTPLARGPLTHHWHIGCPCFGHEVLFQGGNAMKNVCPNCLLAAAAMA